MNSQDRATFSRELSSLAEAYGKTVTPVLLEEYWDSMRDFSVEDFKHAKYLLKLKSKRLPVIADFVETIKDIRLKRSRASEVYSPPGEVSSEDRELGLLRSRQMREKYGGKGWIKQVSPEHRLRPEVLQAWIPGEVPTKFLLKFRDRINGSS